MKFKYLFTTFSKTFSGGVVLYTGFYHFNTFQALYKGNHPKAVDSLNNVGIAYQARGDIKQNLDSQEQALKIMRVLYKGDHPEIATSLNNIGSAYQALGDINRGLDSQEQALKIMRVLYKGDHPEIATSLNNVGIAYQKLGDINRGLDYQEQALKMAQALYKGDHPDVARILNNVGVAYYRLGDQAKVIELFKQAYIVWVNKLGHKHQDTEQLGQLIAEVAPEFLRVGEDRDIIIKRGSADSITLEVKEKLQAIVLNELQKLAVNGNLDIKIYLDESYLHKQLGALSTPKTLEIAKMLCFEAVNLGIMGTTNKNLTCAREFSKFYPELIQKIAKEHPEYFVDGLILRATTDSALRAGLLASECSASGTCAPSSQKEQIPPIDHVLAEDIKPPILGATDDPPHQEL